MNAKPIRLLIVASVVEGQSIFLEFVAELKRLFAEDASNFEIVGIAYNKRTAVELADNAKPDVLLVDLMLPGLRSVEIISHVSSNLSDAKILALVPGDPPYDRVLLALQAGACGFVCKDVETPAIFLAIKDVLRGELHLPPNETFDVLRQSASSLSVSAQERRQNFYQALISLVPLIGVIAAFISYMWREYWGQIGVRVTDLGVDPTARVPEFFVLGLVLLGIFGPIILIETWLNLFKAHLIGQRIHEYLMNLRGKRTFGLSTGLLFFGSLTIRLYAVIFVVCFTTSIQLIGGEIIVLIIGVIVSILLILHIMKMDNILPPYLTINRPIVRPSVMMIGSLLTVLIFALSVEVFIKGPDLRADGMHGYLAPTVLDLSARPAMIYDLQENHEPFGSLYLGGNADLYVLYDPCEKVVRFIPVGSARVELIEKVQCPLG